MIPVAEPWLSDREVSLVTEVVQSGWVSPRGDYVREFERKFAEFIGVDHAFTTTTGTAALHLTLEAAGIGEGDEVIIPDLTYIASANAVRYTGAEPVFVDVDPETYLLDADHVRKHVSQDTAAIMPVHLYGHPCDMGNICDIADDFGCLVIEDAAEAHGARYRDQPVGGIGDAGCFSFYGNKILTTGQGGMITTDDDDLAETAALLRHDGMSFEHKYHHPVVGYNYRMTNMQAALGLAQTERADELIEAKRHIMSRYRDCLSDVPIQFQTVPDDGFSSQWMAAPIFESVEVKERVIDALAADDVETRPLFKPLHRQPPYETNHEANDFPIATQLATYGLNLPSGPKLPDEEINQICTTIRSVLSET